MEFLENLKTNEKLIFLTLLVIPFLKGLFFKEVFLPVFIFYAVLFLLFIIKSKKLVFDKKILMLFIFQIIFGINSTIFGINREGALYGLFLLIFPVIIYFLILNIINDYYKFVFITLLALFFSGSLISIINFLMELKFNSTDTLIRFTWVIPYSNTLAVYLFAASLAGLYLLINKKFEIRNKVLIILGTCLNISALVFTYSRTMLILAVILYILFFLLQKNKSNIKDFIVIFTLSALCVIFYSLYKWNSFFIIFILCALAAYLYERIGLKFFIKPKNYFNKKFLIILIPIIILIIFLGIAVLKTTDIYNRIQTISGSDQTLLERFSYYKDSINIIKDYPIFGIGSGGWSSIMYKYQTAVYFPAYVHSSIVQTAINFGIFGLMIYIMQIIVFFIYFINAFRNKTNFKYRNEIICLFVINLSIILHSIIDIDFEFQIINLMFWLNIVLLSLFSGKILNEIHFGKIKKSIFSFIFAAMILAAVALFTSNAFYLKGMKSFEESDFSTSIDYFDKAIKFNPFSNSSYFMKGNALEEIFLKIPEKNILEEAKGNIGIAEKYDRFNPEYLNKEANILFATQNYSESAKKYGELIALQPLIPANYEAYSTSLLKSAEQEIKAGKVNMAKEYFNKIINIENQLKIVNDRLSPIAFKLKHKPELTFSPQLSYNVSEVYYYLHNFDKARYYAEKALKDDRYIQKIAELKSRFEKHK